MTSSILILTTSKPQATAFVTRLLAHSDLPAPPSNENNDSIDYSIDNKYYSAVVPIVIQQLDEADALEQGGDFPVLIWLLPEGEELTPRSIPSALKTYLSTSSSLPDVALAILTSSSSSKPSPTPSELPEDLSDAYDDLGMELIDEAAVSVEEADEEDEDYSPPLPPLEQISQAIQTHLWPNLVLKAQPSSHPSQPKRAPTSALLPPTTTSVAFPQSFSSLDESLPSQTPSSLAAAQEDDGFGPLQSSSSDAPSSSALDFTSQDFLAALSSSQPQPPTNQLNTQKHRSTERSFTDSFSPPPTSSSTQPQTQPPSFVPPPLNGELLSSDFDFPSFPNSSDPFAGLDAGFQRLVDSDDEDEGNARGLNDRDVDLTSTLLSLRGLREELGRVEDEEERRELAGRVVEGLFGMLGEEGEEDGEGMGGRV